LAEKIVPRTRSQQTARARRIRLIVMDVDGVLTDGGVTVLASGEEVKTWNAKDRLLLALLRDLKAPFTFAWITGRKSQTVVDTASDLGIRHLVQKCADKKTAMATILEKENLAWEQAAFIGDDLIDLPAMRACGFSACPSDAVRDVLANADYVAAAPGGRAAVRDVLEFILRAQKKWDAVLAPFLR
jgi:3-deoxy-D-manno-octulosonate 8-phosphate phosphatase (KDO 8-P phosphatase)